MRIWSKKAEDLELKKLGIWGFDTPPTPLSTPVINVNIKQIWNDTWKDTLNVSMEKSITNLVINVNIKQIPNTMNLFVWFIKAFSKVSYFPQRLQGSYIPTWTFLYGLLKHFRMWVIFHTDYKDHTILHEPFCMVY